QPDMPAATKHLVESLESRAIHKRAVEISARASDLYGYLGNLFFDPGGRRQLEQRISLELSRQLGIDIGDYEILIDLPKPEKWKTSVWVHFDRPPVGFRNLMPWVDVVGLEDSDFKRYEEHRRMIRIVTTERLRDEVANRWETLLLPLMANS
ncbi:MAG: HD domain-containing protein, partial [Thermomicrobiaceae bacterium]